MPPSPHRATIADVARASTVSRALNPATSGMVRDAVVQRVAVAAAYTVEAGRAGMAALLAGQGFTAVVAANDMLALGACDALAAAGLRVGADVSVTGFNDMPFVDRIHPALTTIRIQHDSMGRQAAKILLAEMAEMAEPGLARCDIRLVPDLVRRASTTPPAQDSACR